MDKHKEENFRHNYAIILNELFKELKIDGKVNVENEFTVWKGRIHFLYGNFLIEYKYPTRIASLNTPGNLKFIEQVQRQINGFHRKTGIPFNLIKDFGSASEQSIKAISMFYDKLEENNEMNKAMLLFEQW